MAKFYYYSSKLWLRMFPELMLYEDLDEREAAFREASKGAVKGDFLFYIVIATISMLAIDVLLDELVSFFPYLIEMVEWSDYVFFCLIYGPGIIIVSRRTIRRRLRTTINAHGIPVCMSCGYCLRGLIEQRCPECGFACQADAVKSEESACNEN